MAYNNYAYPGYNGYYQNQTQDQNHTQTPTGHTQAYTNSSNPYSQQYYGSNNTSQYAHQSTDRTHQQYQAKSSIDNPGFQSSYYPQQQYTSTARNDTQPNYSYAPTAQTSNAGYPYNTSTTIDQNSKVFQDNSALGSLAYASTLGGARSTSTISNPSTASQVYQQQQQQQQQSQQQTSGSSSILPAPNHQQSYASNAAQKSQGTPQQQTLYRSNVNPQQRPGSVAIRRSPSLPVKQNSISQTSNKVMSPHTSMMGSTSSRPTVQSSNAHQISTIMNQNENMTTTKQNHVPPQIPTHAQSHVQMDNRSPANSMQSPAMTEMQQPTTIDPNAVFDHAEWARRRRAQEDAEAAKRVKEHKTHTPLQPPSAVVQPMQTIQPIVAPPMTPQTSNPDALKLAKAKEVLPVDEIKQEMKAFAEKLRTWKTRDPSGTVDELWRQTLQGPNNSLLLSARISSQTPQLSRSSVPGKGTPRLDTSGMSPGFDDMNALGSPFQGGPDDMPDLGKFPAMRRRTRADKGVSRSTKAAQVATARAITSSSSPANITPFGHPLATASAAVPLDSGAESMRRAMQAFHQTPTPATPDDASPILVQQQPPPKIKHQPTTWPEEQKPQLSLTAKNFLERQPQNKGKLIAAEDIIAMLNQNPSYDQLCIMLAGQGFSVPRAAFAQELLDVVPSGGSRSTAAVSGDTDTAADDTPAKKPRGRPKKNSLVTPLESPLAPQPPNGGSVKWGNNLTQSNMGIPDHGNELVNGDGNEYASFFEKMRLIQAQSPAQVQATPPQQSGKKRNLGEMGKGTDMNGGSASKKQQFDRPGSMQNQKSGKSK